MYDSLETQAIRKRMEEVRGDLDVGFQGMVDDARDIGDWTYYVKTYPWIILGVSLAAGYLLAPRLGFRRQSKEQTPSEAEVASENAAVNRPEDLNHPPATTPLLSESDMPGKVLGFIGNLVMRGVTAYAVQQADRFFTRMAATSDRNDHS